MSEHGTAEQMMMPKHGSFCWTEVATNNLEACKSFYSEVFGWKIKAGTDPSGTFEYAEFSTPSGEYPMGGMFQMMEEWYGGATPPPHLANYVAVNDVDETTRNAFELGATIVHPPIDIPNVGRMCVIQDPTGAKLSIITLKGGK